MAAAPHKTLGAAAFFAALGSTLIHAGYLWFTHKMLIYGTHSGIYFSITLKSWIAISAALALGGLAVAFFITACIAHRRAPRSWLHLGTLLFLIPAGYTAWWLVAIVLQLT